MSNDAKYYRLAMRIFVDFSGAIAIPAVLGALAGQWLDNRYDTGKRYLIVLLVTALAISALTVYKKAKSYQKEYDRIDNQSKTEE